MTVAEIKAAVRARDGYRCVKCGMTSDRHLERFGRDLDVHRKTPGAPYSIEDCVTMCRPCHGPEPKSSVRERRGGNPFWMARIPDDIYAQVERLAIENDRPVSWEIRRLLTAALAQIGHWPPPSEQP